MYDRRVNFGNVVRMKELLNSFKFLPFMLQPNYLQVNVNVLNYFKNMLMNYIFMISFCEISSHKFFNKHPCVSKIDFDYLQVHFVLDLSVVCLLKYSRDSSLQITVISYQSSLPIIFLSKKQRFTISSITFMEKWPFCSYPLISWRILSRATSIMVHI